MAPEQTFTLEWDPDTCSITYIDQTLLPGTFRVVRCGTIEELVRAIGRLEIRGAPALGIAGAMGVALAAARSTASEMTLFLDEVRRAAEVVRTARPTAVNLSWGVDRVLRRIALASSVHEAKALAIAEANAVAEEDELVCRRLGTFGQDLLPDTCTVLTHCNAGALACRCWGTALGVIRSAAAAGKQVRVIACETRPLNQGSRLTCWELSRDRIDVTLIPDSSAAYLMRKGEIDLVIVGADRITNDAVFNKIGTYMHAVSARHHGIPFYVAAPLSTFDLSHSEKDIIVEERSRAEVAYCGNSQLAPEDVKVLNYAFDATPLALVGAVITEIGVLYPPYAESFRLVESSNSHQV